MASLAERIDKLSPATVIAHHEIDVGLTTTASDGVWLVWMAGTREDGTRPTGLVQRIHEWPDLRFGHFRVRGELLP